MEHIKRPKDKNDAEDKIIQSTVESMLSDIRIRNEVAVTEYAQSLDGWEGNFALSEEKKQRLIATVTEQEKADINFAYTQIKRFAEAQKESLKEFDMETEPGVHLGQRIVPVNSAGCYVPGGRYAHAASALMSITTAKVAGVPFIVAASPPRGDAIAPQVAYAMDLAGADLILEMGGVQAIASMAFGLFGAKPADMLVGPGNAYVAEAKRLLFGEVGIDVFAGPTESAVIADETADPMTVAIDLAGQAEHGTNSPVWLFTTSKDLGNAVNRILPQIARDFPSGDVIAKAWANHGEIIYCETREEICTVSDRYASEHLQVIAKDLDWWKTHLKNYGSLFLGEGANVTHGDKCSGTNHILPTKGAARYSGGLNVLKFLKILTWQKINEEANLTFSAIASRISRMEGMDAHARACDWRLQKYHPEMTWDFEVSNQQRYD
ncbi:histidinol dehydrogenase [Kiloniella spongiae]|uniref:Histidinol dehydrogenase n=1 Tax=Kiloniella spongiae TaxID=1489064 RepID=A0A0H2MAP0_9PROT|nr:histidinol dehydrogenase [Kiloniella spongiae]KLN59584.1 histidinol dehydrogenase [Kiloniella spongiae]